MDLHRAGRKPDWASVPAAERNGWQSIAAATRGIVTPGNIASLVGFAGVLWGLWEIAQERYLLGGTIAAAGRLCDVLDGWLAQKTGTKSPLGEILDAAGDKVVTILTIIVFFAADLAPAWVLAAIVVPHVIITIITAVMRRKGQILHPSRPGKLSMAAAWASLVGFVILAAAGGNLVVAVLSYTLAIISTVLGVAAAYGYTRQKA